MTKSLSNPVSRRSFLRTTAAVPAVFPALRAAAADDEALFRMVRWEFPFEEGQGADERGEPLSLAAVGGGPGERADPRH